MKALLLAAGFGTRLQPHTLKTAKPAMEFLKLPLIAYPLALLEQAGVTETIINTHHLPETVVTAADSLKSFLNMKISYSHESPNILDSAGAIDLIRSKFSDSEPFLLVNADTVVCFKHTKGINNLLLAHQKQHPLATLLTCPHPEVGKKLGGVWVDSNLRIHSIGKAPVPLKNLDGHKPMGSQGLSSDQLKGLHYTGFMVLNPKVLNWIPHNRPSHIFKDVLEPAMANGEMVMSHCEDLNWYETGDWQSFQSAEAECSEFLNQKSENTISMCHELFELQK